MKIIVGIFCSLLFASVCVAGELVGTIVPPFLDGWSHQGGMCITDVHNTQSICDYSISIAEKDNRLFLYLGKSAPRTDPEKARWLVTDQLAYPDVPSGFRVVHGLCERNKKPDQTIIAVVKATNTEWLTSVRVAYKANLDTGRFEKTSIKGIRCANDGWGM